MWTRRQLLDHSFKGVLASGLVPSNLLGRSAQAGPDPHFIVYVQVYGAWDVCLAFDPKDRNLLLSNGNQAFDQPYGIEEVKEFKGIRLAPAGYPLAPFADRLAIVNGIDMEIDNGHTPLISMTGSLEGINGTLPCVQAIVSEKHPSIRNTLIPHLYASYDGFFRGGPFNSRTVTVSNDDFYSIVLGSGKKGGLAQVETSTAMLTEQYEGTARQKLGQYINSLKQAQALRGLLDVNKTPTLQAPDTPKSLASFIGRLFARGILGSMTWSLGEKYSFDTHSDHYSDHPLASALLDLSAFCKTLSTMAYDDHHSMLDLTTVVMTGEFCRTPRLNEFRGKDHNFRSNSALFIGKNVRSGVYGASGESLPLRGAVVAHAGLPIDLSSGRPSAAGDILKMRNLWAGAGSILGLDLSRQFGNDTVPVKFLGGNI